MAISSNQKGDLYEDFVYNIMLQKHSGQSNSQLYRKRKYPQRIPDSNPLEIDISIELKIYTERPSEYDHLTIIECKNLSRPVGREVIDHLISKKEDVKANDAICVSSSGFQSGAISKAKDAGIKLLEIKFKTNYTERWITRKEQAKTHPMHISQHLLRLDILEQQKNNQDKTDTLYRDDEALEFLDTLLNHHSLNVPFIERDKIELIAWNALKLSNPSNQIDIDTLVCLIGLLDYKLELESSTPDDRILARCNFEQRVIHLYRINQPLGRIAFTLAHEIGHILLHQELFYKHGLVSLNETSRTISVLSQSVLSRLETQANLFASSLLMPKTLIEKCFMNFKKKNNINKHVLYIDDQEVNQELLSSLISDICSITIASREALFYRLQELNLIVTK